MIHGYNRESKMMHKNYTQNPAAEPACDEEIHQLQNEALRLINEVDVNSFPVDPADHWSWRRSVLFPIAREFKRARGPMEELRFLADVLSSRLGIDGLAGTVLWEWFLSAYASIKVDPNCNKMAWDVQEAIHEPFRFPSGVHYSETRHLVYSVACYRSRRSGGEPFELSQPQLADALNVPQSCISCAIGGLKKGGAIACLRKDGGIAQHPREEYYVKNKRPKQYIILPEKAVEPVPEAPLNPPAFSWGRMMALRGIPSV